MTFWSQIVHAIGDGDLGAKFVGYFLQPSILQLHTQSWQRQDFTPTKCNSAQLEIQDLYEYNHVTTCRSKNGSRGLCGASTASNMCTRHCDTTTVNTSRWLEMSRLQQLLSSPSDCSASPTAAYQRTAWQICNGQTSCSLSTEKRKIPCGHFGSGVYNDYERIIYRCIGEDEIYYNRVLCLVVKFCLRFQCLFLFQNSL